MSEQHSAPRHSINREFFMPLGYISMSGINLSISKEEEDGRKCGVAAREQNTST